MGALLESLRELVKEGWEPKGLPHPGGEVRAMLLVFDGKAWDIVRDGEGDYYTELTRGGRLKTEPVCSQVFDELADKACYVEVVL
jgi:hypothetical protein